MYNNEGLTISSEDPAATDYSCLRSMFQAAHKKSEDAKTLVRKLNQQAGNDSRLLQDARNQLRTAIEKMQSLRQQLKEAEISLPCDSISKKLQGNHEECFGSFESQFSTMHIEEIRPHKKARN
jgi:hypothetical protein